MTERMTAPGVGRRVDGGIGAAIDHGGIDPGRVADRRVALGAGRRVEAEQCVAAAECDGGQTP